MNLSNLKLEAQRLAGRVDSGFDTRTKNWINEAIDRWTMLDPLGLLSDELTLTSDGTKDLFLPSFVAKVRSIFDQTNEFPVQRQENWDQKLPSQFAQETAGRSYWWRDLGYSAVGCNPSASVVTSGALKYLTLNHDYEAIGCYVEGLTTQSGATGPGVYTNRVREYVTTMSGTAVQTGNGYVSIFTIGKPDTTTGRVMVDWTNAAGSTSQLAAVIGAQDFFSKYRHAQLLYKPAAGTEFKVKYIRRVERLQDDNEMPPPFINPYFLIWWAAGNIHSAMKEYAEARDKWAMAEKFLKEESFHEQAHGDQDVGSTLDIGFWGHMDSEGWRP